MRHTDKSLRQWQELLCRIYGDKNRRDYCSADLLLHVVEEAGALAESLRKEDGQTERPLVHIFSWLLAFATSQQIDAEDAVFEKYHGLCPYCGAEERCNCISAETKPGKWFRDEQAKPPESLTGWLNLFHRIYGNVNKVAGKDKIWLHLLEEMGEVSRAFRLNDKKALYEELADAFAWLFSLCNCLMMDLDCAVFKTFPGKCDVCSQEQCTCPKV
jgi:NTP pyrophosphatase (non-canonical NTP hydrolase)